MHILSCSWISFFKLNVRWLEHWQQNHHIPKIVPQIICQNNTNNSTYTELLESSLRWISLWLLKIIVAALWNTGYGKAIVVTPLGWVDVAEIAL